MELQQAFDTTAKILFGQEIGKLEEFAPYLKEMMLPYQMKKSYLSGKEVMISNPYYSPQAKFISQEEMEKLKFPPLSINEIKDIDSLFSAVSERLVYCGNKLFGRNYDVAEVDNSVDCVHIFHSHNVYNMKYGAYLSGMRDGEYVFGGTGFPGAQFAMRILEGIGAKRCFESYYATNIADMYYSFNCIGCSDCIFAFNLRSKRHCIGNLELYKDEYERLKRKLVAEMEEELQKKKRLFSITDIAYYDRDKGSIPEEQIAYDGQVPAKVEEAFAATTGIVLGKKRHSIKGYAPWLLRHAMKIKKVKGAFGSPTYKVEGLPIVYQFPADRLVTLNEGIESTKKPINIKPGEELDLKQLLKRVAKVAYFSVEFIDGQNENCIDTPSIFTGSNVYKLWDATNSKYSAYSTGVVESEHIFGGSFRILKSQFCINCFDSTNLKGCFEVDASYSCRDCCFCHNCENVENGILCFNAKSLRYAVGNTQVGKEEYLRIKKLLLDYINAELDSKNGLGISVFSIPYSKKPALPKVESGDERKSHFRG